MLKYSAKKYQSPLNSGLWANSRTAYRTAWQNLFNGEMCKPHDCGNHRFYGVFSEDKKRAWGLLATVKDTDNAILHPSQYATDRWLGKPDQPIKAHLMGQLKADPNWK